MLKKITLLLLIHLPFWAFAQNDKVARSTNRAELLKLAQEFEQKAKNDKLTALFLAQQMGWEVKGTLANGQEFELMAVENGLPIYYITDNAEAAITTSTTALYSGPFNVTGNGISPAMGGYARLGEWDGGAVRLTHQEFDGVGGTVTQADGATSLSNHATHVAGTMVANGTDASARGMAYNGDLSAHDWNSDLAEMANAAANGMLISNHSYGFIRGWRWDGSAWIWFGNTSISDVEDYLFGFYNANSQAWDLIANNAPYYLMVKSAGNDRGDGPGSTPATAEQDGGADGYDCIGDVGVAKNILTVGAVNAITGGYSAPSDVVMSSFSGWGPADDGRIKPDIVGNGVGVYSSLASGDTDYASYNGTSMASPNVSGSLLLLQEHYENLYGTGNFMLSATLKGLIIHTANEAGLAEGPDYIFGWGLLDSEAAAQAITDAHSGTGPSFIQENTLSNGETYTLEITSNGQPLRITICWNDPAATPVAAALDPTDLMLVNDLDARINHSSTTYSPYILDPSNPSAAATTGDNFRDNIEQIYISSTTNGDTYTLTINHKGTLSGGSQDYSLIISGATTITPEISFVSAANTQAEDNTNASVDCQNYRDYSVTMQTSSAPVGDVIITPSLSGTATEGMDYTFSPSSITFANGNASNQSFNLRIFDDAEVEANEDIVINYSISGTNNAVRASSNQTYTFTIENDDATPSTPTSVTLLNEDWSSGDFATNGWTANGSNIELNGTSFLLFNWEPRVTNYEQTLTSAILDASALENITLDYALLFDNFDNNTECGVEVQYKKVSDASWTSLENFSNTAISGDTTLLYTRNDQALSVDNSQFQIRFRFYGGDSYSIDAIAIDNIIISGEDATEVANSIVSKVAYLGPNQTVNFYSPSGDIMATIENLSSHDYGCTTVEIDRTGTAGTAFFNTAATAKVTDKTFKVTPTNNNASGSYRIKLYYTEAEISGWETATGNSRNNLTLLKSPEAIANGTTVDALYGTNPSLGILNTDHYIQAEFSNGFSGFGGSISGTGGPLDATPLPVSLLSFQAQRQDAQRVELTWQTAQEINNKGFEIEVSKDGIDYHSVGFVEGVGNSASLQEYRYISLQESLAYYRLKQIDFDDNFVYSQVRFVGKALGGEAVAVYPNPFSQNEQLILASDLANFNLQLSDAKGLLLWQAAGSPQELEAALNRRVSQLASGIYILKIQGTQIRESIKLMKR